LPVRGQCIINKKINCGVTKQGLRENIITWGQDTHDLFYRMCCPKEPSRPLSPSFSLDQNHLHLLTRGALSEFMCRWEEKSYTKRYWERDGWFRWVKKIGGEAGILKEIKKRKKKLERKWKQNKHFCKAHRTIFHCQINPIFGYGVLLKLVYNWIVGYSNIKFCLKVTVARWNCTKLGFLA